MQLALKNLPKWWKKNGHILKILYCYWIRKKLIVSVHNLQHLIMIQMRMRILLLMDIMQTTLPFLPG